MPLPGLPAGGAPSADERRWTVRKGRRVAVCWQRAHPLGFEVRVDVNGDTMRSTLARTVAEAQDQSARMHALLIEQGWIPV